MRVFDWTLKFNGFPIDKAKTALQQIQNVSEANYASYLNQKKKEIVAYHLKNNTSYKSIGGNINLDDWSSVPIMTKRDLQQPLHLRLSDGFSVKNCYVNKTSGSSGDPFIFAKDKFCHALTWAIIQNRFGWFGLDFNSSKQARFYGIPLDKKGYYKERIKDVMSNRFRFSVFDLSDQAFEKLLEKFKAKPFEYINGYTSAIVQFAKFLERKKIILTQLCPSLTACVVTSEMLFEDDKLLLEEWFGVPVVNEYGASELDLIAFQNPNGQWQVNSETLFVEILDEDNQPRPYGQEGRIVITSLYNKAHPFIRYDIGDIGVLSKSSSLKLPILEKLIGRTNDIAVLPSGKKAAGLTFYYITKALIEDDGNVKEFVIEQLKPDIFKVRYTSHQELSEEKKSRVKEEIIRYLEPGIQVLFEREIVLKRSKGGKLKQFVSSIKPEDR
ncbi:phenylacetate--CoA ligase family protein [Psychroserpens sp. XS_ASV72]|uniref:phenylacetate--CoA ligase family protein n=1 Tax=Psychroserpens sp. XS_ASV72 TaxID=3241293 RepID=UPI003517A657